MSMRDELMQDTVDIALENADVALPQIRAELERAVRKFGAFHSAHEGYAVLLEEVDELWDEIKRQKPDYQEMHNEAMHVATMALRFMVDVTLPKLKTPAN